jgi:hypothetical protein
MEAIFFFETLMFSIIDYTTSTHKKSKFSLHLTCLSNSSIRKYFLHSSISVGQMLLKNETRLSVIISQEHISQPVPDQLLISPNSNKELIDSIVLAVPFRCSYWPDVSYWSLENGASLICLMVRDQSLRGKEIPSLQICSF